MLIRQIFALVRLSFVELWRRHDVFALAILALAVMVPLAFASPFGAAGASRYLDEIALLLIWAFSLALSVGTAARLFPTEFEAKTIYPLLAKPISRRTLLLGKYLGAVAATGSSLALFYALFAGSVLLRGGALDLAFAQGVLLHFLFVAFAVALTLFGSLVVSPSANRCLTVILLVVMFFFGRRLPVYAENVSAPVAWIVRAVYAVAPHAEFFDMRQRMIHGWGAVDGLVFAVVIGYAVVYIAILLALAHVALKRKGL